MVESMQSLQQYWTMFCRRRLVIGCIGGLLLFLVSVLAIFWPPTYQSTAMILIIEQEIPSDLIRSTITRYADQQIERLKTQVLTRSRLMPIIEEHDLYKDVRKRGTSTATIKGFIDDITIEVLSADFVDKRTGQSKEATIAFTLSYEGKTPEITQKIANQLTTLFLSENLKNREKQVQETTAFLKQESEKLANALSQLEQKIASFKHQANGALPELFQMNMQLLSQVQREIINKNQQIQVQEERIIYLEGEMANYANSFENSLEEGLGLLSLGKQLQVLRREYASLASYLSPEHPDIIKIQQEIEALEQQGASPIELDDISRNLRGERLHLTRLLERYGEGHPDVMRSRATIELLTKKSKVPESFISRPVGEMWDDPAYVGLQTQLASAKTTHAHLSKSKAELELQAREYSSRIEQTPKLEPTYQTLTRDRDNTAQKFQQYRSRLLEAQVAEGLELELKGERFSLVEPATLPESPIRPNRKLILLLGLVLAILGGLGSGMLAEALDGSIHSAQRLGEMTKMAPLTVIPYFHTAVEERTRGRRSRVIGVSAMILTLASFGIVHLFLMPLDDLWFEALRKLRLE